MHHVGIDLSVHVPVYTLACTYFYSLIVCSMSKCCVNFNMNINMNMLTHRNTNTFPIHPSITCNEHIYSPKVSK